MITYTRKNVLFFENALFILNLNHFSIILLLVVSVLMTKRINIIKLSKRM